MSRYKDMKTGKIYDNIRKAMDAFCLGKPCGDCPLYSCIGKDFCGDWCIAHPEEAARIMGLEAIDEPAEASTPLNEPASVKPRLAEVLGVEVGEWFKVKDSQDCIMGPYYINSEGVMVYADDPSTSSDEVIYIAINHPESIIRASRLTPEELEQCRAFGAKWVSRDKTGDAESVVLWEHKPTLLYGGFVYTNETDGSLICSIHGPGLFPSVKPGDRISVEEAGT